MPITDSLALVQEMGRVARRAVVIVTHGKPEGRMARFTTSLKEVGDWSHTYARCELSLDAQFINIIRANFPGRTMASVMKDRKDLLRCVAELALYSKQKKVSEGPLRQDCCYIYLFSRQSPDELAIK